MPDGYEIHYYGFSRPSSRLFRKQEDEEFEVEVIDTWEMTIEKRGRFSGMFRIELPGKEYMAIRLIPVKKGSKEFVPTAF